MTRPIKFRAWDSRNKKWAKQFSIQAHTGIEFQSSKELANCVIEQFIGLTDKRGEEIFEGDLLRYVNPNKPKKDQPIHEVVWVGDKARFLFKRYFKDGTTDTAGFSNSSWGDSEGRFRVIGNIHENPELVK